MKYTLCAIYLIISFPANATILESIAANTSTTYNNLTVSVGGLRQIRGVYVIENTNKKLHNDSFLMYLTTFTCKFTVQLHFINRKIQPIGRVTFYSMRF